MIKIISVLYILTALFYLTFGALRFWKGLTDKLMPSLFPLLSSAMVSIAMERFTLFFIGLVCLGVSYLLWTGSLIGLICATTLSLFEVYLAQAFYWHIKKDKFQTILHYVVHIGLVLMTTWLMFKK